MLAQAGFKQGLGGETPADLLVRLGPTFRVDIGLKSRAPKDQRPDLPLKAVLALIDTGAGGSCIDERLAETLGLPITDEGEISGIGGKTRASFYTARLYVPDLDRLLFEPFAGVKLEAGGLWHRVILGRNFLRPYRMVYNGSSGQVELGPSEQATDRPTQDPPG